MKDWNDGPPMLGRWQDGSSGSEGAGQGTGVSAAIIYALVAHRLSTYYDDGHWMNQAQGAALVGQWMMRSKLSLPLAERKHLSELSEQVALQIRDALSREAGLHTAHELMESLDPRYESELGAPIMEECVRVFKAGQA